MDMDNPTSVTGANGTYTVNGKPIGYSTLTPFIVVNDPAGAIAFYEQVFHARATSVTQMEVEGQQLIVHAEIDFGDGFLQIGAATPSLGLTLPPTGDSACYSLGIYVPDVDRTATRAEAAGARIREPLATFVSGDRYCSILDPFGIRWSIMTRVEDLSQEESNRRVDEWSKQQQPRE